MRRPAGMSGGRVLRAVGRAVGTGADAVSAARGAWATKPARSVSVTSANSSTVSSPTPPASASSSFVVTGESQQPLVHSWFVDDWAFVWDDNYGWEKEERLVFGPVPTREEAEEAVATIQQIVLPLSYSQIAEDDQHLSSSSRVDGDMIISTSTDISEQSKSLENVAGSGVDWIEPSQSLLSSRTLQSSEHESNVFDALQLLQVNPAIQKMVVSLSSDKAVWDAVMKNDVVQEIKKSFSEGQSISLENTDDRQQVAPGLLKWILENIMARFSELVDNVGKLVKSILHQKNGNSKPFHFAVKTSFMLSVMAFIVIIVGRLRRA